MIKEKEEQQYSSYLKIGGVKAIYSRNATAPMAKTYTGFNRSQSLMDSFDSKDLSSDDSPKKFGSGIITSQLDNTNFFNMYMTDKF
jgi:hypothetical protein